MKDIVFITGNQAKADYLTQWLGYPVSHQKIDLDEIQSLDALEVIEHKARQAYERVQRTVLVEDVSLSFEALGGKLPGTLIKWFLHEIGNDGMLRMLSAFDDRRARASLIYGLYDGQELHTFSGAVDGTVPLEQRGTGTFGTHSWNTIFVPNGSSKTYAEMSDEELRPFSHRAQAIDKLRAFLGDNFIETV